MIDAAPRKAQLSTRSALISIVALWLFYFVLTTVRAAVLDFPDLGSLLVRRVGVSLLGVVLTYTLYRMLRPAARASLPLRIAAAFFASLPFATLFSAINYAAFYIYAPIDLGMHGEGPGNAAATRALAPEEDHGKPELTPTMMIVDGAVTWYFIFVAWSALYLAMGYAGEAIAAERRAAEARAEAQSAELRALRYQVNPHFLFNTLNSLSSLVLTNQAAEAERMIMNLATFFRTSLSAEPTEDVLLAEEIRLQMLYLDIEMVRFPERLKVVVDIPDGLRDACVPGLILQPLVENAIKYGVSRTRRPVTLGITATERHGALVLRVEDDGDPASEAPAAESNGVGLVNVRARLQARFGEGASAQWAARQPHGFAVELVLPLVRHDC